MAQAEVEGVVKDGSTEVAGSRYSIQLFQRFQKLDAAEASLLVSPSGFSINSTQRTSLTLMRIPSTPLAGR